MTLATQQAEFMAHVLEEGRPLPPDWDARFAAGLEIYRSAYRTRLVDALRETFPCTAKWVGEEAFRQAAAHHVILSPPTSWTLDDAGEGFVEVLEELFAQDPEVAELGWLEWAMHCAFVAGDTIALDRESFAAQSTGFTEIDWTKLRLSFQPAITARHVRYRCAALWSAMAGDETVPESLSLEQPMHLMVWREGLQPVFRLLSSDEYCFLELMRSGASYGTVCAQLVAEVGAEQAVSLAGQWLGRWIGDGLVTGFE